MILAISAKYHSIIKENTMFVVVVELPSSSEDVFSRVHIAGPFESAKKACDCLQQSGYTEEDVGGREIVYPPWHCRDFRAEIRHISVPRTEEENRRLYPTLVKKLGCARFLPE